jgi:Na+-driven multidrug efflux pump
MVSIGVRLVWKADEGLCLTTNSTPFAQVPIVIVWMNAENILLRLGQDEAVAYRAGLYIRYLAVGLPGYALNQMMRKWVHFYHLSHLEFIELIVMNLHL